jgi:hypothetical protein
MTDQYVFFTDKHKMVIAAMSLSILLLLPASLGVGKDLFMAYAQFNLPLLEEEDEEDAEEENGDLVVEEDTTMVVPADTSDSIVNASTFLLRGFIGSTISVQDDGDNTLPTTTQDEYVMTGRWRVFANDSIIHRFVAEMHLAAVDGTAFHNVTLEESPPHRFEVTEGNETAVVPEVTSDIVARIYVDGGPPAIDAVPMTITIRGQVLAIEDINIDEARIIEPGEQEVLNILDGQTIYGTNPR